MRYFIFYAAPPWTSYYLDFALWLETVWLHATRTDRQTERTSVRIAADMLVLNAMTQDGTKENILHSVHIWLRVSKVGRMGLR